MRGGEYWPLYDIEAEHQRVVRIIRFYSIGPRTVYEKGDSSDKIKMFTREGKLLDSDPSEICLSDEELLGKLIREGKNRRSGIVLKDSPITLVERLRVDDCIVRDAFSEDMDLERLFRLHHLTVTAGERYCLPDNYKLESARA